MSNNYDVFLSYSRHDKDRVRRWVERMEAGGVRVFFDTKSLVGGMQWQEAIVKAIEGAKVMFFMASRNSFQSNYTPRELTLATSQKGITVVPVFLDDVPVPPRFALSLAVVHRIEAWNQTEDQVWDQILKALSGADVIWKEPVVVAEIPRQPQRRRLRDDLLEDLTLDPPKIEEEPPRSAAPLSKMWLRGSVLALTCVLVAGFGIAALVKGYPTSKSVSSNTLEPVAPVKEKTFSEHARKSEPKSPADATPQTLTKTSQPDPTKRAQSVADVARNVVRSYFAILAADRPHTELLGEQVDYYDRGTLPAAQVRKLLDARATTWPTQVYRIANEIRVEDGGANNGQECRCKVEFEEASALMRRKGSFMSVITVEFLGETAHITSIGEVVGSHVEESPEFLPDGQLPYVQEFVRHVVRAGNSDSNMDAEAIARLFEENANYSGAECTREDIVKQTEMIQSRWTTRTHEILEGPTVVSGLGTDRVVATVKVRFSATYHTDPNKKSSGVVVSQYGVHFNSEGLPLVESFLEMSREK